MFKFKPLVCTGIILSLSIALAAMGGTAVAATQQTLKYTVLRDGDPVGSHVVFIQGQKNNAKVTIKTNVVVKFAFIPVYHFLQTSEEIWQGGQLAKLESTTDDDGTKQHLTVRREGERLNVATAGTHHFLQASILPASLWNPALTHAGSLLNTIDGKSMAVSVDDAGQETMTVQGAPRNARHFLVRGDLKRELWYDDAGNLVRVRFTAKDDSVINYVLD